MKLSIIIPVYNASKTLQRCLESILIQRREVDIEIILVDDGSTDNSLDICKAYSDEYPYIQSYKKENGGVSSARNFGLNHASGDYITFMDNDDEYEEDYLIKVEDYLHHDAPDILITGIRTVENDACRDSVIFDLTLSKAQFAEQYYTLLSGNLLMTVWNKFFRRDIVNGILFEEGRINAEDYLFCLEAYSRCKLFRFAPLIGYRFYQSENSASHRLYKRYDPLHELDSSIQYRNTTNRLIHEIGVSQDDIALWHRNNDYVWFYYMVKNVLNPGTPYKTKQFQIDQIRKIMDFKDARDCILTGRSKSKLSILSRILFRINSPRLTRFMFTRVF